MSTDLLTDESCGLRERKKRETRRALNLAALDLVEEKGFAAVTAEEIAARAGVSARTFFNYFPSKDDAVLGLDPAASDSMVESLRTRPVGESPVQAMRAVAHEQAGQMAEETELWPLRLRVIDGHPALLARLAATFGRSEQAMAAAIAERTGSHPHDLYPLLLAGVAAAAMRSALHRWLAGDFTASLPDLVDEAWDVLAAGLPAPPSR